MSTLVRLTRQLSFSAALVLLLAGTPSPCAAQSFSLYTPFTEISVPPGESIDYPIDVINKSGGVKSADIAVESLPRGWTYLMKSGGWNIGRVAVLPGEKKSFSLQVQVPLKVNKGVYHFAVAARGLSELPLTVVVSQQGTFKTEFTTDQANMAGAANSTFTFNARLRNVTDAGQAYALNAAAPPGWRVTFKASYKQVSSVNIEPGHTQDISIEINPTAETPAGTYKIPVTASTGATSADLGLEVGITGSYGLQLTTPTGLLSTSATAGDDRRLDLVVKNTGSADLKNVDLLSAAPPNWNVSFDPKKIDDLPAGQSMQVAATITPDDKAIVGDYMTDLTAKTAETSALAPLRVSVETSLLFRGDDPENVLVVTALDTDADHFRRITGDFGIEITEHTMEMPHLQVQGPRSRELLSAVTDADIAGLRYFRFLTEPVSVCGAPCYVARTGYSGELGYEVFCEPGDAEKVWQGLLDQGAAMGIRPYGLAAVESPADRGRADLHRLRLLPGRDVALPRQPRPHDQAGQGRLPRQGGAAG